MGRHKIYRRRRRERKQTLSTKRFIGKKKENANVLTYVGRLINQAFVDDNLRMSMFVVRTERVT